MGSEKAFKNLGACTALAGVLWAVPVLAHASKYCIYRLAGTSHHRDSGRSCM
ncbi:hypothetical protein Plhal304r1_c023g0078551 [Plasmopara halstedii]